MSGDRLERLARLVLQGSTEGEQAAAARALAKAVLGHQEDDEPTAPAHRPSEYDVLRDEVLALREEVKRLHDKLRAGLLATPNS